MERSAVVQADALAPLRQRNALARICDFLEDKEGAADRRDSAALITPCLIVVERRGCLRPGFVPFNSLACVLTTIAFDDLATMPIRATANQVFIMTNVNLIT